MKNIIQLALGILFLLICSVEIAHAQIEPQYNLYRLNPQVYNPMTAGSRGDTSEVFVMYRQQSFIRLKIACLNLTQLKAFKS